MHGYGQKDSWAKNPFEEEYWMKDQEINLQQDLSRPRNSYLASKIGNGTNMLM